jgi:hypothetical protein
MVCTLCFQAQEAMKAFPWPLHPRFSSFICLLPSEGIPSYQVPVIIWLRRSSDFVALLSFLSVGSDQSTLTLGRLTMRLLHSGGDEEENHFQIRF